MKTTITTTTLFFIVLLLSSSCESDAFFEVDNGHTKLFAFSEIASSEKIKVYVNTAVGINTEDDYMYPKQKDAQVILYQDGIALEDPGFRYIENEQAFVSQGSFRPEVGVEYGLQVTMKNPEFEIESIYAETSIPVEESLTKADFSKEGQNVIQGAISLEGLQNDYFQVMFILLDQAGNRSKLSISDILGPKQGLKVIGEGDMLLLDKNANEEDEITLELFQDLIDDGIQVEVELYSITADAYSYYKAFSGQMKERDNLLFEPVIDRSNFQNGLGLFAGHSQTVTTYVLK